jgi:hypothetical protein
VLARTTIADLYEQESSQAGSTMYYI